MRAGVRSLAGRPPFYIVRMNMSQLILHSSAGSYQDLSRWVLPSQSGLAPCGKNAVPLPSRRSPARVRRNGHSGACSRRDRPQQPGLPIPCGRDSGRPAPGHSDRCQKCGRPAPLVQAQRVARGANARRQPASDTSDPKLVIGLADGLRYRWFTRDMVLNKDVSTAFIGREV